MWDFIAYMFDSMTMSDWSINWLGDWLTDWLDGFPGWIDGLTDFWWLNVSDWLTQTIAHWLSDEENNLTDWLAGMIDRQISWPFDWLNAWLLNECADDWETKRTRLINYLDYIDLMTSSSDWLDDRLLTDISAN